MRKTNFEYVDGTEKIVFEILTGNKYLELNSATKTKFSFENIDPKNVTLIGRTIHTLKSEKNELIIEMSPKKKDMENGNLVIRLTYKSNNDFKNFTLYVPVK